MGRRKHYFMHPSKPRKNLFGLFLVNDLPINLKLANVTLQEKVVGLSMQLKVKTFF